MAGSCSPSLAPSGSKSGSDSESESSHRCPNCCPELRDDYVVPWTVHLLDMPPELQWQIYLHLPNLASVVSLRLTCRQLNEVFQPYKEQIMLSLRNQLTEPIREYYEVLQRLKFEDSSIKYPPPGGWPNITPEIFAPYDKTNFALSVLRHLPYINDADNEWNSLEYKSAGIDFSVCETSTDVGRCIVNWHEPYMEEDRLDDRLSDFETITGVKHIVTLSMGHESGGIYLVLDTFAGIIFEEEIRGDGKSRLSPRQFCDMTKDRLERLEIVYCCSEENWELNKWDDKEYWGDDGKFYSTNKHDFKQCEADGEPPTDEDGYYDDDFFCWVAYLYHKFGWPGKDYRKEECKEAILDFQMRWRG